MPREKSDEKRDRILEVAKDHFLKYGYRRTYIDEIAKDAMVAKGTLYIYFKDKDELAYQVFERETAKIRETILKEIGKEPTAIGKLRAWFLTIFNLLEENPQYIRLLSEEPEDRLAFLRQQLKSGQERALFGFEGIIKFGIMEGSFRDVDSKITAYAILKLFQSFTYLRTFEKGEFDKEQIISFLIDFINKGIGKI